jgi:hypothetical protein
MGARHREYPAFWRSLATRRVANARRFGVRLIPDVGSYTARLRLCPRGDIVFTGRTTTLTVHVVPRDNALARTGPEITYELLGTLLLLGVGTALCRAARVER